MSVGALGWTEGKPRYFSGAVSDELAVQLDRAARLTDPLERESILLAARRHWPHALDVMIALYKLYFRTARFPEAERMAWQALREASCQGGSGSTVCSEGGWSCPNGRWPRCSSWTLRTKSARAIFLASHVSA